MFCLFLFEELEEEVDDGSWGKLVSLNAEHSPSVSLFKDSYSIGRSAGESCLSTFLVSFFLSLVPLNLELCSS